MHSRGQAGRATTARWGGQGVRRGAVGEDSRGNRHQCLLLPSYQQAAGGWTGDAGAEGDRAQPIQGLDSCFCCAGPSAGRARGQRDVKRHGATGEDGLRLAQTAQRGRAARGARGGAPGGGERAGGARPSPMAGSRPRSGPSCSPRRPRRPRRCSRPRRCGSARRRAHSRPNSFRRRSCRCGCRLGYRCPYGRDLV